MAPYRIIQYINRKGIIQLAIDRSKNTDHSLEVFYRRSDAIEQLERLCFDYQLCPRYCNLQNTIERCSHYRIKNCKGICHGQESVALYNMRVQQALASLKKQKETYLIREKGRTIDEHSFVMIQNGIYKGFGYVHQSEQVSYFNDFETFLILQKHTYHTTKIIKSYLRKHGENNVIYM